MFMAVGQKVGEGRIGPVRWREDQLLASRHKLWTLGPVELERVRATPMAPGWSPLAFELKTIWRIRLHIGRLNLEAKWNG